MKKIIRFFYCAIICVFITNVTTVFSQNVGINTTGATPDASAILDVVSTTSGVLIPRMTAAQVGAIVSPATGLMVYVTDLPEGFYYYNGADWVKFITKDENGNTPINQTNANADPSAFVHIQPDAGNNKGLLIPRLTAAQTAAIASPATGLMVYVTDLPEGLYYYNGADWVKFISKDENGNVPINQTNANADPSAFVHIQPDAGNNKGLLIPRLTSAQAAAIASPATGLMVYVTDVTPGFYYNSGTPGTPVWVQLITSVSTGWLTTGNAGTIDGTHFIGSTDNIPLNFRVNNQKAGKIDHLLFNTFLGYQSGNVNTTGVNNTGIGYQSLYSNNDGSVNTAIGYKALYSNTSGSFNTATGQEALYSNNTGNDNTASGYYALHANTTGSANVAHGEFTLNDNTTGSRNAAIGYSALLGNIGANDNVAFGYNSLFSNTYSGQNIAIGNEALYNQSYANANTPWATDNVAVGIEALYSNNPNTNSNGQQNTAVGNYSLRTNVVGIKNAAFGYRALYTNSESQNTAIGHTALESNTTGASNTAVGYNALNGNTTSSYNTAVGSAALSSNVTGGYNTTIGTPTLSRDTYASRNVAIGSYALNGQSYANGNVVWATDNVAIGYGSLYSNQPTTNTNGYRNTAIGSWSLYANSTGYHNTSMGYQALYANSTGFSKTETGDQAL